MLARETHSSREAVLSDIDLYVKNFKPLACVAVILTKIKILFTITGLIGHDFKLLLLLAFHGLAAFKCGQVDCYSVIYHHDQKASPHNTSYKGKISKVKSPTKGKQEVT